MSNLDELLTEPTTEEVLEQLIVFAQMGGFPTSNWAPFGLPRTFFEADARFLAKLASTIKLIAGSGFNRLASGKWLDLLSENFYANTRKPAVFTEGRIDLRDAAGVGPITKAAGTVWVSNIDGTKRYRNLDAFTIPLNGIGLASDGKRPRFQAESAGIAWNLANGVVTKLVTSIPGVSVSNPANLETGSWITVRGDEQESDESLRQRNEDKWSTIGRAANEATYRYWATTLLNEVRRVRVVESPIGDGKVFLYLAGTGGGASPAAVAAVDLYLQLQVRPLCSRLYVAAADNRETPVSGDVYVKSSFDIDKVMADTQSSLSVFFSTLDIGSPIYKSALIDVIMGVDGVYNTVLDDIAVTLGPTEVAVPNLSYLTALR